MRTIAIGDIHGCNKAFELLLGQINPQPDDVIVTLGDYIDRGPGSKEVIGILMELEKECNLKPLMGNHELMLIRAMAYRDEMRMWLFNGGLATLQSYDYDQPFIEPEQIKRVVYPQHASFLSRCEVYYEDDENIFIHANYHPLMPMDQQTEQLNFWQHINDDCRPDPHMSGKTVWVGHTPQSSGKILDLGHVVCVDTGSFRTGWVTAVDVNSRKVWQANENGRMR